MTEYRISLDDSFSYLCTFGYGTSADTSAKQTRYHRKLLIRNVNAIQLRFKVDTQDSDVGINDINLIYRAVREIPSETFGGE